LIHVETDLLVGIGAGLLQECLHENLSKAFATRRRRNNDPCEVAAPLFLCD